MVSRRLRNLTGRWKYYNAFTPAYSIKYTYYTRNARRLESCRRLSLRPGLPSITMFSEPYACRHTVTAQTVVDDITVVGYCVGNESPPWRTQLFFMFIDENVASRFARNSVVHRTESTRAARTRGDRTVMRIRGRNTLRYYHCNARARERLPKTNGK